VDYKKDITFTVLLCYRKKRIAKTRFVWLFADNGVFTPSVDLPTRFCVLYASTGAFYCTAKRVILG